ncbi:MAG: PepSY domain-containing protein [Clostridia bacterium]|nr:PepSY domain-containing protein [Clostridia bacterium]
MLKKKILLSASIVLIISLLAMMISAAPLVKDVTSVKISAQEAENIALEKAGLTRDGLRFERTELDRERGKLVWEVDFENENKEYSFEIDAVTGKILREDIEEERRPTTANTTQPPATEPPVTEVPITEPPVTNPPATEPPVTEPTPEKPTATEITREDAINIALKEAGLSREQVRELEAEKDYERGTLVYEVEFEYGRNEYSYEIRVSDGKVLTNSIEIDD